MKSTRMITFIFHLLFIIVIMTAFAGAAESGLDCYTILVGKDASANGNVIIAHNEDDSGQQIVNLYKVPSINHNQTDSISFRYGASIPQQSRTNGFIWLELPGMEVSDGFINEYGVTVVSNGCPSREENPELTGGGILYWVRRLIAERSRSAREAIKLAGRLISEFGYASSGRTYSIADRKEAWMLAAVNGKHWVAQRVPDDQIAIIPNYYTIGEIDLADTLNFLGSPDIIDYAAKRGWYDSSTDGAFHFAKAYTALTSIKHHGNIDRKWRGLALLGKEKFEIDDDFPFALEPAGKVSVQDIMSVLRDHYKGCELDKTDGYRLGNPHTMNNATICSGSTQYSIIAELREGMPLEIGTRVWLAFYRPGVQAYTPLYLGMENIPDGYALTDHVSAMASHFEPAESVFDTVDTHRYWTFVRAVKYIDEDFGIRITDAGKQHDKLEKKIFKELSKFEKKALATYQKNPEKGRKMLTEFSEKWLEKAWELANTLAAQ